MEINKNKGEKEELLIQLFENWSGEKHESVNKIPQSGSNREYYRIKGSTKSSIGVFNKDRKENIAFIEYAKHFKGKGLSVPNIYEDDIDNNVYLQEDFGDETLYSYIEKISQEDNYLDLIEEKLKQTVSLLPEFQYKANQGLNYKLAYPREAFDKQSMQWDLSYFKYYFLKLADISFDEQLLENDFQTLIDYLSNVDSDFFLFRDFQSRNIMILEDGNLGFIDFQGGRKGAIQYDLASLLYGSKVDIPHELRNSLIDTYIESAQKHFKIDNIEFKNAFYPFALIRIMQAMGAYGYRGFFENKKIFLKRIPFAINNLSGILKNIKLNIEIPHLMEALNNITKSEKLMNISMEKSLKVSITSFSYKKGIPQDTSGNGGGYVFDCRWIHNPGRYEEYKKLTGRDQPVIDFLDKEIDMKIHLDSVFTLVDRATERFIDRGFTHLMVNFGCTGGQHRSVYSAEHLAKHLVEKYGIKVRVQHIEQNILIEDFSI